MAAATTTTTTPRPARSATTRILDHAIGLLRLGIPNMEAIEIACVRIATCPVARDRARAVYLSLLARAEREAAAA